MKAARVSGATETVKHMKHMKPSLPVDLLNGSYAFVPYKRRFQLTTLLQFCTIYDVGALL